MKKFSALMLFALSAFLLVSCGGEEKTECQTLDDEHLNDEICPDKKITFCVTESGKGWFKVEGKKYECKGNIYDDDDFCDNIIEEMYHDCHDND